MKSNTLGVVVVRLQVPELHAGHRYLLNTVTAIHSRVLVVIGDTEARLTPEDPLTFEMRETMLRKMYPSVIVQRLTDHPSDLVWSQHLDTVIAYADVDYGDAVEAPVLYGGRDSFLKHYHGKYRTFELPPLSAEVSGTEARAAVEVKDSADFREGMIYASRHRYPTAYQCVDAIIVDNIYHSHILLGRKERDGEKWRFVGGFVTPGDPSLEEAVMREVREETGVEPLAAHYVGSAQIDDFRYPKTGTDRLMSALFIVRAFGPATARDDLFMCAWFPRHEVTAEMLVPEHAVLFNLYTESMHAR